MTPPRDAAPRGTDAAAAPEARLAALRPLFGADAVLEAVWLYHHERLTQAETARALGVSRATVHNLLRAAEDRGLVRTVIDSDAVARGELALALSARFGLDRALVAPAAASDGADALPEIARAAAAWLADLLGSEDVLGVAWGRTVHLIGQALPRRPRPGMRVVQLVGSAASPYGFSAEGCAIAIAGAFGAPCATLHAPAAVSSAAFARRLAREPIIAAQLAALAECDAALFAVGLCGEDAHIVRSGLVTPAELAEARAAGAAGVIAGRFIDAEGRPMALPADARVVGIALDALRAIPRRILVGAGADRLGALRAALRGAFAATLVTDAPTARALIADDDRPC